MREIPPLSIKMKAVDLVFQGEERDISFFHSVYSGKKYVESITSDAHEEDAENSRNILQSKKRIPQFHFSATVVNFNINFHT